jgi:hypothetical protein
VSKKPKPKPKPKPPKEEDVDAEVAKDLIELFEKGDIR